VTKSAAVPVYLLMLVAHVAHMLEETWGHFWLMNRLGASGWFLANWVLFCVPVALFCFVLRGKRWASSLSTVYAGLMIANGLGHNIATLVSRRYFDGFAGAYSGIALIGVGVPMMYVLRTGMPTD
jgi:hypothetical protein